MTEAEKTQLKEKALARMERVKKDIIELEELCKPIELSSTIGRLTRMDAINNRGVNEAALQEAKQKQDNLNYVISKYGTDDFGKCVRCKGEIPLGRLMFMPESIHCVNCAGRR